MADNARPKQNLARRTASRLRRKLRSKLAPHHHEFAEHEPSPQQTVDIFAGQWVTAFPESLNVTAGWVNHFHPDIDTRVPWAATVIPGGFAGKSVLELGPFEGYHTASLEWAGAGPITAVEASRTAYLKCLVTKELLQLNARVLFGDVPAYLATSDEHFDIVWASGILYHQANPVAFLEAIGRRADYLFLHTHYFDAEFVSTMSTADRFRPDRDERVSWHGREIRLHRYEYESDTSQGAFAGGPRSFANWLERSDIEFILQELGFSHITYGVIDPNNPAGPGFYLVASRP